MFSRQLVVASVLICCLASWNRPAGGQEPCQGDVDGDGIVDARDVVALPAVLFDGGVEPETLARADANDDGVITAGDVVAILHLNGFPCGGDMTPTEATSPSPRPTVTPTPTPSAPTSTPTMTATPTTTSTQLPTPTATAACMVQTLSLGTTNGELTPSDCQRDFGGELRYADAYSIVGTPGQAITVDAAGTGDLPIVPYVSIVDADGQFQQVDDLPPIEFVVTSSQPYLIYISSVPGTTHVGTYQVTASARPCPTPIPLTISPTLHFGRLDGSECPDPTLPQNPDASNPVDVYTFTVTQVPTNLQILMRQTNYNEDIDPVFFVVGPDGYELFPPDDDDNMAPAPLNHASYPGNDAGARFLATVPGTYTLTAGTNSGFGAYSLQVSSPGSPSCAPRPLGTIPSTNPLTRTGQLFGDYSKGCGPPLPIPGVTTDDGSTDLPQPNSGADLYTFAAQAGDVISVGMDSDGDARLFLYGPASAGNPRVAQDANGIDGSAQLAATLALPGTYTIVAANNYALAPPDPSSSYPGDVVNYTLSVQKCPVAGALVAGVTRSSTFTALDCAGFGGLPFRSYAFVGNAGQFVSVSMTSDDLDPAVRLLGPDGSQVYNDNDLFDPSGSDARINRILPASGTYFVEVSASLTASGSVDLTPPGPGFAVQVQTCATTAAVSGTVSGAFQASDCELPDGRKYDVYTFAGPAAPAQRVASISPPTNGCIVGLYAEGLQTPDSGCSEQALFEMPAVTAGKYGFMIAANDDTVRGNYSLQYRSCPLSTVHFGDNRSGALSSSSCTDGAGIPGDWYLMRGAADLVNFNSNVSGSGVSGEVTPGFGGRLTDFIGDYRFFDSFSDDAAAMLPFGRDLAALIKVTGPTPGNYTLSIDTAASQP